MGDCHKQSLLAIEYCLGVQNNTWTVKVLKDDHTLRIHVEQSNSYSIQVLYFVL
jgi:hypothetical protein